MIIVNKKREVLERKMKKDEIRKKFKMATLEGEIEVGFHPSINEVDEYLIREIMWESGYGLDAIVAVDRQDDKLLVEDQKGVLRSAWPIDRILAQGFIRPYDVNWHKEEIEFENDWNSYFKMEMKGFQFFERKPQKPWLDQGVKFINMMNGEVVDGDNFLNHVDDSRTGLTEWWAGEVPAHYKEVPQVGNWGAMRYNDGSNECWLHIKYIDGKFYGVIDDPKELELYLVPLKGVKYVMPNLEEIGTTTEIKLEDPLETKVINFRNLTSKGIDEKEVKRMARNIWGPASVPVEEAGGACPEGWSKYEDFSYRIVEHDIIEILHFDPESYDYRIDRDRMIRDDSNYGRYYQFKGSSVYCYRGACAVYTGEFETRQKARKKAKRNYIRNFKKDNVVRILRNNPEMELRKEDSIKVGNCESGTRKFAERHFPNRESVKFKEILENHKSLLGRKDFRAAIVAKKEGVEV